MRDIFRKVFSADNLLATLFIFSIMWVFSRVNLNLDALNPVQEMFGDFQLTDLVSSRIREEMPDDTNIVIINIGELDREGIAKQIEIINKCRPKVIGIDAFFYDLKPENIRGDQLLAEAFLKTPNLVLVSKLFYHDSLNIFDSLITSHSYFMKNVQTGSANLVTEGEEKFRTARVFSPFDSIVKPNGKGWIEPFFAVKVAELYRSGSSSIVKSRGNELETILFRGNIYGVKAKFPVIDAYDILDSNFLPEFLTNKIVLMGYLGKELGYSENIWDEDKFFTPLNDKYVGKAVPDMYGLVVHANIVSMILNNHFVDESPLWLDFLFGIVFCFMSVVAFHVALNRMPQLFDPITKVIQLFLILGLIYLEVQIYRKQYFRIDFGIALAAIALAPDLLEIYLHLIKRFVLFLSKNRYIHTKFFQKK